jgi:SAM-dependent methyltransferase
MTADPATVRIHAEVSRYYDGKLATHGPTPQGVDWRDRDSQRLRHAQFRRLIADDPAASVLDLGCGYGDFAAYLREIGHRGPYIGCDLSAAMIAAARTAQAAVADCTWIVGTPGAPADYAIASGILNVRMTTPLDVWQRYVDDTVLALARLGGRGFGFNALSLWSDPERRRADLHYLDPLATLAWCRERFGRSGALLADYGLYEFTVLVRHAVGVSSSTATPKPLSP